MSIYNLNHNQKIRAKMYRIHKKPRYKLIELNQKKYLMDLEENYFIYLFPMLNWILKKDLIEISSDKLKELEYDNKTNKEQSQNIRWISSGTGVLIALLMRPFMELLDVPSSIYINLIIFMILAFSIISIRIYLRKKWDLQLKENVPRMNCKIRPTFKYMFISIGAYLLFLALSIFMFPLIFLEKINILMCLCSLTFFFFFSLMNLITYDNEEVIISKLSQSE
ncbi:DUF443 family protein [Staphylococcus epidermidis]|nr:DUF443 family protein [Staphylococcus epidermidis]MCG1164994.1 DUF443 family protein [Staphylococcus epidermidis]MCG2085518.1 DUF443 family protein [Staphylococcus epidermidis]MCG2223286.1 DUF443 family protein [Staphylococcus epidermidis]MCG2254725.1 DUF443 family protein [Staphylococcus epidermidis]